MIPDHFKSYPALTIRQPWAWFILHGGKNIENRCWNTNRRGWFLIHAAKGCTAQEYLDACIFAVETESFDGHTIPPLVDLPRGAIVGAAKIGNCVTGSDSPWFVGEYGFVLDEVVVFDKPTPCKGMLGFFRPQFELK